jgi:hypothetical protein
MYYKLLRFYRNYFIHMSHKKPSLDTFFNKKIEGREGFNSLFDYFLLSYNKKSIFNGTRQINGTFESKNGKDIDSIEGVSRQLPYLSAKLLNVEKGSVEYKEIKNIIRKAILNGTDNLSNTYWGDVEDYDQLLCEMSDIALSIWITRDIIWVGLSADEQDNVLNWLRRSYKKKVPENNWILFSVQILIIIKSLDSNYNKKYDEEIKNKFNRVKEFAISNTLFRDGISGPVDYYTSWGFIYSLFWLHQIDPSFESEFISSCIINSASIYQELFDENGIPPLYGRSIIYRGAAIVPILAACFIDHKFKIKASDLLYKSFNFYTANKVFLNGSISLGYIDENKKHVDDYSSSNSVYWFLRPIVISEYLYSKKINIYDVLNDRVCSSDLSSSNYFISPGEDYKIDIIKCNDIVSIIFSDKLNVGVVDKSKLSFRYKLESLFKLRIPRVVRYREDYQKKISSDNSYFKKS